MKIIFSTMAEADRTTALTAMSDDDLTKYRTEARTEASTLFAKSEADLTLADADLAESLMASIGHVESEQARRATEAKAAADKFAAAKAQFSETGVEAGTPAENQTGAEDEGSEDGDEDGEDGDGDEGVDGDPEAEVEAAKGENPFPKDDEEEDPKKVTTASARRAGTRLPAASAARKVGGQAKRPVRAAKAEAPIVITAAADVPGVSAGSVMEGLPAVTTALQKKIGSFPTFNLRAAQALQSEGETERLNKVPIAAFNIHFDPEVDTSVSTGHNGEYSAVQAALGRHKDVIMASMLGNEPVKVNGAEPLTAAAWCAPSETVYTWLADYVVDGLITIPEVSAPRGGLFITTGPALAQTTWAGAAVDDFGFGGTEADMETGTYVKTCETIECPEFEDHRLDFDGYCWKIPILTEKAYPELVTDAMRLTNVLYAHKMNRRFINDILDLSTAVTTAGLGAVFTDSLEALTIIAIKERRWWNIGENATLEVKLPQYARAIFKMDMARRAGLALDDVATDQKVAAHFANHGLAVEYVSDFGDIHQATITSAAWPATIPAIIYPSGTFVKAVEPVINLSGVHDAASLSKNEYTGVFFEQGVMTIKVGYRSHKISIPVNTAGLTGALILDNHVESTNWAGQKAAVVA